MSCNSGQSAQGAGAQPNSGGGGNGCTWGEVSETRYVYDGMRIIQERNSNNVPTVSYTRGSDFSLSVEGEGGIGGLLARSSGYSSGNWTTNNFYFADGNGNVAYMLNSSQSMVASYRYDPFGNSISCGGTLASANVYRFSSKEIHVNSGMYYYGYRFYDPNLQRWINRDPLADDGFRCLRDYILSAKRRVDTELTLHGFVSNEPLDKFDPFGLSKGILGIPGTGGMCCNNSGSPQWWLDDGKWKPLPDGKCTGTSDDCDGMTCAGGFYSMHDLGGLTCPKDPFNPKYKCSLDNRRWTPGHSGPDAKPPTSRGAPNNDPPPGYKWSGGIL